MIRLFCTGLCIFWAQERQDWLCSGGNFVDSSDVCENWGVRFNRISKNLTIEKKGAIKNGKQFIYTAS